MKKIGRFIHRFPLVTFFVALGLIMAIIMIGTSLRAPQKNSNVGDMQVKRVHIFDHGDALYTDVSAKVDRADTVVLRATASGIVTRALTDGTTVVRGQEIVKLADTYSGATGADAAAAVAQRNAQYHTAIAGTQNDIFRAQDKEINRADDRAAKIARKQVFLAERAAAFARDSATLQAAQASAVAATYRTVAPLAGRVEEVRVRVGDTVNRGDVVAILHSAQEQDVYVVAYVGAERAAHVDVTGQTSAFVGQQEIPLELVHIAARGDRGQAYALTYRADKALFESVAHGAFLAVRVPLTAEHDVLVPLDSVRYGATYAEIYILDEGVARARRVTLGDVLGSFVVVHEGITQDDHIILDRTVTDGERVEVLQS